MRDDYSEHLTKNPKLNLLQLDSEMYSEAMEVLFRCSEDRLQKVDLLQLHILISLDTS